MRLRGALACLSVAGDEGISPFESYASARVDDRNQWVELSDAATSAAQDRKHPRLERSGGMQHDRMGRHDRHPGVGFLEQLAVPHGEQNDIRIDLARAPTTRGLQADRPSRLAQSSCEGSADFSRSLDVYAQKRIGCHGVSLRKYSEASTI